MCSATTEWTVRISTIRIERIKTLDPEPTPAQINNKRKKRFSSVSPNPKTSATAVESQITPRQIAGRKTPFLDRNGILIKSQINCYSRTNQARAHKPSNRIINRLLDPPLQKARVDPRLTGWVYRKRCCLHKDQVNT